MYDLCMFIRYLVSIVSIHSILKEGWRQAGGRP
jgi:hypothetical protein